ncbi:MAG TPA: flagella basal body P-ring formation protein FlgA [Edaphobacter sp.]|nr:flagella basal body P-ring formation protein FlgA [Edaphobacter sp.]
MLTGTASANCYSTPDSAIATLTTPSSAGETPSQAGYRIARIQTDSILGLQWVSLSNCSHPEWPPITLSVPAGTSIHPKNSGPSIKGTESLSIVHAGDIVHLWKDEGTLRIEVGGVSLESGGVGKKIRVRLLHGSNEEEVTSKVLFGVIRGPSNVEMQQ